MTVLSLIFSQIFQRSIENYPIYYLTGYLLWQTLHRGLTNASMTALADNKMLLLKVKFPMELFILTRGIHGRHSAGLFSDRICGYACCLWRDSQMDDPVFSVILLGLFFFSLGVSYLLCVLYVFFGDVKHLYSVFLTLWMYCSAIFYPIEQLHGFIRTVIEHKSALYIYPLYAQDRHVRGASFSGRVFSDDALVCVRLYFGIRCL